MCASRPERRRMTEHFLEQPRYPGPFQDRRLCVPALLLVCRGSNAVCQRLCSSVSADRLKIMRGKPSHMRTMGANQRGVTRCAQELAAPPDLIRAAMSTCEGLIMRGLGEKGCREAAGVLPQPSALLPCMGFVAGGLGVHRPAGATCGPWPHPAESETQTRLSRPIGGTWQGSRHWTVGLILSNVGKMT